MIQNLPDNARGLVLSYLQIRRSIGALGLLLPILLGPLGWLGFGIPVQDNMSSYYHTAMRDVFVGILCAIGIFLFCYRGYDWIESWTANLGCLSALGIALFPLDANSDPLYQASVIGYLHTLSGGVFFLTLSFYSLYHFPTSKWGEHEVAPHETQRNFVYPHQRNPDFDQHVRNGSALVYFFRPREACPQQLPLSVLDGVGCRVVVRSRVADERSRDGSGDRCRPTRLAW